MPPIDALFLLHIYHFTDSMYLGVETSAKREQLVVIARREFSSVRHAEDAASIAKAYADFIEGWGELTLPSNWTATHDYWSARCFHFSKGWNAPKRGTLFAGDASGRYMAFDSLESLRAYTAKVLREIEQEE